MCWNGLKCLNHSSKMKKGDMIEFMNIKDLAKYLIARRRCFISIKSVKVYLRMIAACGRCCLA